MDVEAEYQEDQPQDDEQLEPAQRVKAGFLEDDDEEFSGEEVNLVKPHPLQGRGEQVRAKNMFANGSLPQLPPNLQKVKDIFDFMETQKAMKKLEKEKKKLKKTDRQLEQIMHTQDGLLNLVARQNEKNLRLEQHLAGGIGLDRLNKGQSVNDNYDPLDDISFDDHELEDLLDGRGKMPKKKKKIKVKPQARDNGFAGILPMMMMMGGMQKAQPNTRHEELFALLNQQEQKIQQMLEEQKAKKMKDGAQAKNAAMMERLYQLEEHLLNTNKEPGRLHQKKVDFTELMKAQQLYQRQLVDTLIDIGKRPKNRVKPTVYLPVPIRDPELLPPDENMEQIQNRPMRTSASSAKLGSFGDKWTKRPSQIDNPYKSTSKFNPSKQAETSVSARPTQAPQVNPRPISTNQQQAAQQHATAAASMNPSYVGASPNYEIPPQFQPTVLRVYKRRKDGGSLSAKVTVKRQYRISGLRKYALGVLFAVKLILFLEKGQARLRKEAKLAFDENVDRIYNKIVKFLRTSLTDSLEKAWSLEEPISITRRKKLFALYDIDQRSLGPSNWETVTSILTEILQSLNKFCNEEFLDPDIVNFFATYTSNKAFLKDNQFYASMLERLEFDRHERLMNQSDQRITMILIFEIIFECLISRLLTSPKDYLLIPPQNPELLRYNMRHLGSVLFALFEDWIVNNTAIDKRSPKRPFNLIQYAQLDKEIEPSIRFMEEANERVDWKKRLYVFSDIIPRSHLIDLQNYFITEDYELLENIRDAFLQRLLNTILSGGMNDNI